MSLPTCTLHAQSTGPLANLSRAMSSSALSGLILTAVRSGAVALAARLYHERAEGGPFPTEELAFLLYVASQNGHADVVRWLLETLQAPINNNTHGRTALYVASKHNHIEVVKLLTTHGANKDLGKRNGASALCVAAKSGHVQVVQFLVEAGASVDQADDRGWTPVLSQVSC